MRTEEVEFLCERFRFEGTVTETIQFGSGHINDTFRVTTQTAEKERHYILQRINNSIFAHPEQVMENVVGVTNFLQKKICKCGGNPERETLNIVLTKDGQSFYKMPDGNVWRAYLFIENATAYDQVPNEDIFYQSAYAFGHFQRMLADYPAYQLFVTIPDFHNTVKRFSYFQSTIKENASGRLKNALDEVGFLLDNENISYILLDRQEDGRLPLRVTHNDTKLNNVMIDNDTGKAICVIDLDTVMPGLSATDFGDAIRFGASTASEDEKDLRKVNFDLHLYEVYAKGFLAGCEGALTCAEIEMLPYGALVITYEQALRFLSDYIAGDVYYKVAYPEHNLVRARTQIKLVQQMQANFRQMQDIISKNA